VIITQVKNCACSAKCIAVMSQYLYTGLLVAILVECGGNVRVDFCCHDLL